MSLVHPEPTKENFHIAKPLWPWRYESDVRNTWQSCIRRILLRKHTRWRSGWRYYWSFQESVDKTRIAEKDFRSSFGNSDRAWLDSEKGNNIGPAWLYLVITVLCVLNIVTNSQNELIANQSFVHKLKYEQFRHFTNNQLCFFKIIRVLEYLSLTDGVVFGLIEFYVSYRARLPSPSMIYQQLDIHTDSQVLKCCLIYRWIYAPKLSWYAVRLYF